jgi:hypothetical protein
MKGKGLVELAKGYVSAQRLVGSKGVIVPGKEAKPEEWGSFWNQIGRPESPDGYKLPEQLPEGIKADPAKAQAFAKFAHENGLTGQQFAALVQFRANELAEEAKSSAAAKTTGVEEAVARLRKEWGPAFDERLAMARDAAKRLGGEALLANERYGNDPDAIMFMANVGKMLAQDSVVGGGRGRTFTTAPAEAEQQIQAIYNDPEKSRILANPRHEHYKSVRAELDRLYPIAYPGKTTIGTGRPPFGGRG